MWSFIHGKPDSVVQWAPALIYVGLFLGIASGRFGIPGGITAGFMVYLGACAGSLARWRYERGLWMLAIFFLLFSAAVYGLFAYGEICDMFRGLRQPDVLVMADTCLGTMLLSVSIRFLWQVGRASARLSMNKPNGGSSA